MPLHPQAAAVLETVPPIYFDLESMTPAKARAADLEARTTAQRLPAGVTAEAIEVPGAAGPLRGRVYRPNGLAPVGTVLWIRGGGFMMLSSESEAVAGVLASASGCAVVSVEYRLAPEHPFPAGLEDCYAAACWCAERASELGGHPGPIAIAGESAGGNLAAAVTLMARDQDGPDLALQVLLVPMTARFFDGPSRHDPSVSPTAPPEALEWVWQHYLGDRAADPLASPLDADTLAGLPPALVITAEYDLLRDEGEAYARRLEREGVAVELRRYDGMHHGFTNCFGRIDAADECAVHIGAAIRRAVARSSGG